MTGKQKTKKLSRESILSEAKRLFSSKGYRGTTLRDLTGSFGVSRPSLYYYYKSKMDILSELHATGFNKAGERFDKILMADIPTKEKFRKILVAHTHNLASDIDLHKIYYFDEMEMPEKLRREIRNRRRSYTDKIIGIYKKGVKEGIFKDIDPKVAVYLILGACNWLVMWYSPKKQIKPEKLVDYLMTILSGGYEEKVV
ncbi:MAG: TetR family transcriptional regulator [Deltaproteobacteria bacterium]|nr:TetR family transcriptional regulator [Deltaproteobacteria bacterium]